MNDLQRQSVFTSSLGKGQMLVVAAIVIGLMEEVVISFLDIDSFSFGRFLATALLLYLLYEGYTWTRWSLGVLFGVAGLGEMALGFVTVARSSRAWLVIGAALLNLVCMAILFFSKSAVAFLEHRKTQPKK